MDGFRIETPFASIESALLLAETALADGNRALLLRSCPFRQANPLDNSGMIWPYGYVR